MTTLDLAALSSAREGRRVSLRALNRVVRHARAGRVGGAHQFDDVARFLEVQVQLVAAGPHGIDQLAFGDEALDALARFGSEMSEIVGGV